MPCSRRYLVQALRITTSRADKATSRTTLTTRPAGSHGASSPPFASIHHKMRPRHAAMILGATMYPALDGVRPRDLRRASADRTADRGLLENSSSAELFPNERLPRGYVNRTQGSTKY